MYVNFRKNKMKILIIGSGAREHTLAWKISQSEKVTKIFAAPGNGGIAQLAECVDISDGNIDRLLEFALKEQIDLTIVGPELPLVKGIVDIFEEKGLRIFGPHKKAANLEGSKAFSKDFMAKYNIPTAKYRNCKTYGEAADELNNVDFPIVIKADGLAAGKGVLICKDKDEALKALRDIMQTKKFGSAGETVVIEEFMTGIEASLLCFVDGNKIVPMESARDYKKAYDGDFGLNTGGMGCFSPNPIFTEQVKNEIKVNILDMISSGLSIEGIEFKGILFIGLMINETGTKVLEFNVRFGDPEAEVVIPRLESDLVEIIENTLDGKLTADMLKWSKQHSHCVIAASGGYPENYEKGKEISGLNQLDSDVVVFHGGTKLDGNKLVTNGGRVLAVAAKGNTLEEARAKVYENISKVSFDKIFYRKDIGKYELLVMSDELLVMSDELLVMSDE